MGTPTRMRLVRSLARASAVLLVAVCLQGCWGRTQLWPEPMDGPSGALPPGDSADHPPGPEEVTVLRHADPVRVRPAGALAGYPMAFYDKRARLSAGGSVIVAPGGRAEVLWPAGSSILLFGRGIGWVGSPSRGEALFEFQEMESARLDLQAGDRVELLGGAILSGDSGPYMIERERGGTQRVRNQSDGRVQVAFRDEVFELDPGQSLQLPLLSSGGAPRTRDLGQQRIQGPGFVVGVRGPLDVRPEADRVEARTQLGEPGERSISALGVVVELPEGEEAVFSGLGRPLSASASGGAESGAGDAPPAGDPVEQADPVEQGASGTPPEEQPQLPSRL